MAPLGPVYYSLGDENYYRGEWGYSPYGMQFFRDFLKARYGTIERLNEAYGSDDGDFDAVPRYRPVEALAKGLVPAYVDHHMAQDEEWAAYHHLMAREIREKYDPHARVGAEGSECKGYEAMVRGLQLWAPSVSARERILLRSLTGPEFLCSGWWGGYHDGPRGEPLWEGLMRGFINFQTFFQAVWLEGALNPDFSFRDSVAKMLPKLEELYAGPVLLLTGPDVTRDETIAFHHSRASELASKCFKNLGTALTTAEGVIACLYSLDRDSRYVSARQMAAGELQRSRVLFLPASNAVSETEAAAIEQFVRDGGTVVALLPPAVLSEFGNRLPAGRLDEVFGAGCAGKTAPMPVRDLVMDTQLDGRSLRLESPRVVVESALEAHGAQVLARSGDTPLLLVNEYGKGRALLLNLDISLGSKAVRVPFIEGLLEAVGGKHRFWLEGHDEARLHVLYRGAVTLLGVVLPDDSKEGVTLRWSEPAHVYDVRAGAHLGRRNELAVEAPAAGRVVHLFALQSEPVRGVTLTTMDRLMRIDVVSPAGERIAHYRDFVTLDAQGARSDVPFAFNDMPGRWTIEATDVASGVSGTAVVEVR